MQNRSIVLGLLAVLGLIGAGKSASADVFGSYTCDPTFTTCAGTVPVSGGNFDLVSNNTTTGAAGLYLQITGTLALNQLLTLSASYDMTTGSFGGGAPRFSIYDTTTNSNNGAYVYWGTPSGFSNPNANGTFASTGNYADLSSPDLRVYVNGFGGQNTPNTGESWSTFVGALGSTDISYIYLDIDAGTFSGAQELLVSNFTVNGEVDAPASSVPEPGTLALFGLGIVTLGALRHRKAWRSPSAAV
jgi:hypothetical protein